MIAQSRIGFLRGSMLGTILVLCVVSGCAKQPVANVISMAPTTPSIIIATKVPALTLIMPQVPIQVINTLTTGTSVVSTQISTPLVITSTLAPTITASGPTLDAKTDNTQAFNKKAPDVIGAFKRVDTQSLTSINGATMQFRNNDGTVYQVVLWITPSAQDALTRYQVETSPISAKQTLNVGDEGIIAVAGPIMAEVRYRNMVLIVYHPTAKGSAPRKALTHDEIVGFVTALFKAIPQS